MTKLFLNKNFVEMIEKFIEEFMFEMYPEIDHIVARKYFRELFQKLIPKYFLLIKSADK